MNPGADRLPDEAAAPSNVPEQGAESFVLTCVGFRELAAGLTSGDTSLMPVGFSDVQMRVTERFRKFCPSPGTACDAVPNANECVYRDAEGEPKRFETESHCISNVFTKDLRRANYQRPEQLDTRALPPTTWVPLPEEHEHDDGAPPAPAAVEDPDSGRLEFERLRAPAQAGDLLDTKLDELDALTIKPSEEPARIVLRGLLLHARSNLSVEVPGGRNEFVDSLMADIDDRFVGTDNATRQRRRRLREHVRALAERIGLAVLADYWVPHETKMGRHAP